MAIFYTFPKRPAKVARLLSKLPELTLDEALASPFARQIQIMRGSEARFLDAVRYLREYANGYCLFETEGCQNDEGESISDAGWTLVLTGGDDEFRRYDLREELHAEKLCIFEGC